MSENAKKHTGGCHCGAVRFEVSIDLATGASRCNCSICQKLGRTTSIVKPEAFALLSGAEDLTDYVWGSGMGHNLFCKRCGTHSFSRGHLDVLGGDFVSVNVACLDDVDPLDVPVVHWDGRHDNWEAGPRPTAWPVHRAG